MSEAVVFTPEMYEAGRAGSISSAAVIAPLAMSCTRKPVTSVIDVGCGEGWFAREFAKRGVLDVTGYDYTATHGEVVDGVTFRSVDLTERPVFESADLAVCLEVAEHLPESAADGLIGALTASAPYVLFSAAIPGQGGNGHINCQWPAYWVEKFNRHGFAVSGALRWFIWNDPGVEPWYKQNLLLATYWPHLHEVDNEPWPYELTWGFQQARTPWSGMSGCKVLLHEPYPVVHPDIWNAWVQP